MLESVASLFKAKVKADEVNSQDQFTRLVASLVECPIGAPGSMSPQEVADTLYQMDTPVELLEQALATFEGSLSMADDLAAEFGAAAEGAAYRVAKAKLEGEWQEKQRLHEAEVRHLEGELAMCSNRIQTANVARRNLLMSVSGEVHLEYGKTNQQRDRLYRELTELRDEAMRLEAVVQAGVSEWNEGNCEHWTQEDDIQLAADSASWEQAKTVMNSKQSEIDRLLSQQRQMLATDSVRQLFANSRNATLAS